MQHIADIISATIAVFGTKFAPHKFRATSMQPPQAGLTITVHDWEWTPITVQFAGPEELTTVLGIAFNLTGRWEEQ